MRFRYFDPLQQSTVEGSLDAPAQVPDLVTSVRALRSHCAPAVEFLAADGSTLVIGVADERAVLLWTDESGTTSHSVGESGSGAPEGGAASDGGDGGIVFDYFGAYTELPGRYALPLEDALAAVGGYVTAGGSPTVRMLVD